MKKIALCSLAVFVCTGGAYAANQCKTSITFTPDNNNWNAGSNEYLFETKRDYLSAVNSGYFYECDSSWCPNNSYVRVESGHVFKGLTVHESAYYKCSTSLGNDKWERVNSVAGLTECTKQAYWKNDFGIDKAFQQLDADEYLYPSTTDRDALSSRVYAQVYECDDSVCNDGTIITLPAGHVFQRKDINQQRKYKCVLGTPGDDKWVDITDDCKDCEEDKKKPTVEQCTYNGKKYNIGDLMDTKACSNLPATRVKARTGQTCELYCMKRQVDAKKPIGSYSLDQVWMVKDCAQNQTKVPFDTEYGNNSSDAEYNKWTTKVRGYQMCEGTPGPVDPGVKSCKDSRTTPEGKACCDLPATEAKWENNQCKCLDSGKEFKIVAGKGACVVKESEPSDEAECFYRFSATIECANGSRYSGEHRVPVTKEERNGLDCTTFQQRFEHDSTKILEFKDRLCSQYQYTRQPDGPSSTEISNAAEVLKNFAVNAKEDASVWKDAEGNFNTTRLASDLTAGVVLGTVGGVVSGVVIKKKQVEKGFDALHCTVGGQTVADWGDTFSVGLRR